ncbi:unnamed protein product [Caenorhabditis auriculariae]|uniref:G protein-coupled receptor n=1 Tax=Caenorhabditis auriculariae TaxID=2777116 RepID=A0A8S1HB13_9PELO|nr:unnamed protein product [Caenorhabditis auriculariae]
MPEIDVGFIPKWFPRFFCLLSFISNSLLIYLVVTQNKCKIGPYRQFLVCFAVFDMTYSAVDVIVGMASHNYKSAFAVFVSHGPLVDANQPTTIVRTCISLGMGNIISIAVIVSYGIMGYKDPVIGEAALVLRCSFVCLSYGIFEIHFIYRYIALCRPKLIHWFTRPIYILGWICFCLSFGIYWGFAGSLIYLNREDRDFLRETFLVNFNANIDEMAILGVRYKINKYLKITTISTAAKRVHRQLFLALIAQTAIPFLVSFVPCLFLWYTPFFSVNLGSFNNIYTIPMLSAFPFCDPIAIIAIFSEYRAYILNLFGFKTAVKKVQYSSANQSAEDPVNGQTALIIRCGFICLSYGIFEVHFIYRYIALCRPNLINWFTRPIYIFGWICFCMLFGVYWVIPASMVYLDKADRDFLRETFLVNFNANIDEMAILGVRYKAPLPSTILRTCIAMGMVNFISVAVIVSYCVMGYKINKYLKVTTISAAAKRVHKQLFLALIAQTTIPFVVSFLPCIFLWYTPLFNVSLGSFNNYYTIPMLSAFPFCDPIAIIAIFSEYRAYVLNLFGLKTKVKNIHSPSPSDTTDAESRNDEDREFLRETFRVSFNANIDDIGILGIRYKATQPTTILRTCVALGMANVVSISVIVSYCVMGYKVIIERKC